MDPSEKVCIVTGGAQGLGKEVAKQLLQRGAKVCILDVLKECGRGTVNEFQSEFGKENVMYIHCDITNKGGVEVAFNQVEVEFGGLDFLFNNAGVAEPRDLVLRVNLQGSIDVMELAISRMRTDRGGKGGVIVCTSSMLGIYCISAAAEYHASKAGIIGYTRSRALECGKKYGINFRIVAPNIMHTKLYEDFVQTLPADLSNIELFNTAPEEDTQPIGLVQAARSVLMCMEDKDLPQGALIKIVKDGSFLMFPEKMPSRKLRDP